jgi:uncharacterized protein
MRNRDHRAGRRGRTVDAGAELTASVAVLAYNAAVNRAVPDPAYVPSNLTAAGLSVLAAREWGVSWADMGLRPDRVGRGLRVGLAAAAPVAAAMAVATVVPATRRYLMDERARTGGAGHVLYHSLVRIPLGTALAEETIFRGALLGLFLQRHSRARAVAMSSLLFGACHVLPTLDTLRLNPVGATVGDDLLRVGGAVLGSVLVTAAAGAGFAWLRFRADSTVAPAVAHASVNCLAFLGARLVARRAEIIPKG